MATRELLRFGSLTLAVGLMALPALGGAQETKPKKEIYPAPEAASADIKAALAEAAKLHKRVILDFGGNWCGDCVALDKYFHQEPNASLLKANFILVDINIGQFDKNTDIAKTYGVPLEKGVPALAVLDSDGHTLYSQKNGEFEAMRTLSPSSVTEFLNHWKG
ncbi:MAG TPA: thioredoxin family protein [Fimbriimonadaceae bacterium]|nr:thioredoxin family protein [Fimbriimonadaceae bacterium]